MKWLTLDHAVLYVVGISMACILSCVLVHVLNGNRNKWLIGVISLLIVANIGLILLAYAIGELYIQQNLTIWNVFLDAASVVLQFVPFSLSHFMLADKYRNMLKNIPCKLEGKPVAPLTSWDKFAYWALLAANIIFPLSFAVVVFLFRRDTFVKEITPSSTFTIAMDTCTQLTGVFQIVSGVILIKSVWGIRSYFKQKGAMNYINTSMLLTHAAAFCLYLVSAIGYFGTYLFVMLFPGNTNIMNMFWFASIFFWIS
jgi:hypothetical protein